jgi:hypothetical protein
MLDHRVDGVPPDRVVPGVPTPARSTRDKHITVLVTHRTSTKANRSLRTARISDLRGQSPTSSSSWCGAEFVYLRRLGLRLVPGLGGGMRLAARGSPSSRPVNAVSWRQASSGSLSWRAAVGDGVAYLRGQGLGELRLRLAAERVVDRGERQAKGDEGGDGEDLPVIEPAVAQCDAKTIGFTGAP